MKTNNATLWHPGTPGFALTAILAAIGLAVFAATVGGCAQSTDVPTDQQSAQQSQTNAASADDAATQGSSVNINVINAPGNSRMPNGNPELADGTIGFPGLLSDLKSAQNTTDLANTNAGYAQAGINISVSTGSTTPTLGGANAGAATGTQTASATPTATPSQTITPELTTAMPVGVALPGGIADVGGSAGGSGGTATLDKQSQNEQRQAFIRALAQDPSVMAELLKIAQQTLDGTPTDATSNGVGG